MPKEQHLPQALMPTSFKLESSLKAFGLDKGFSDGSAVEFTYNVPPGLDRRDFMTLLWTEKERLDRMVLRMELAKGSITKQQYDARIGTLTGVYDKLLGRVKTDE